MIIPESESEEKSTTVKSSLRDEGSFVPDQLSPILIDPYQNFTHSIYLHTLRAESSSI